MPGLMYVPMPFFCGSADGVNIGTRVMLSTPPAITQSIVPDITACAAKCSACCDEPHCRSSDVPGTDSGRPDASTALRATFVDCSPTWLTQPRITSSTSAGSAPVRATSASMTCAARSTGCHPERRPPRRPPAVRTAATMKASAMMAPVEGGLRMMRFMSRTAIAATSSRTLAPAGRGLSTRCRSYRGGIRMPPSSRTLSALK